MTRHGRQQDDETKAEKGGKERQILLEHTCFGLMTDFGLLQQGNAIQRHVSEILLLAIWQH